MRISVNIEMTKVSAWVGPDHLGECSKKADDLMLVFSIMDTANRLDSQEENEILSVSNHLKSEENHGFLSPLRNNLPNSVRYSIENALKFDENENEDNIKLLEEEKPSCGEQLSQEAAHLFREVCECGKRTFLTRSRSPSEDSLEKLLNSTTKNSLTDASISVNQSVENRMDQLCTIFIILVTIFTIFILFWIRNFDLIMRSDPDPLSER